MVVRDCKISKQISELSDIEKKYEAYRAIATADHEIQLGIIAKANETIAIKDGEIDSLNTVIQAKETENAHLSNQLDDLQNTEPSYPDMETHPLVINLRAQIKTLESMYSLARETISQKDLVIDAWTTKYNLQVQISESWKKQYTDENTLRIMSEGLTEGWKLAAKRADRNNKLYKVLAIACGAIAGYELIK
jgi:uncharacterized coiled-coil protein SlyX